MRIKPVLTVFAMTTVVTICGLTATSSAFPAPPGLPSPPNVSVRINGYLPPPPGVQLHFDSGRPYYEERHRRVYIERERPVKYYKKDKHHGRKKGHSKQGRGKH